MPMHVGYALWNTFFGLWLRQKIIARTLPRSDFTGCAAGEASMFVSYMQWRCPSTNFADKSN